MTFDKLPFNWFDIALLVVLFFGLRQGRKNGLSVELLGVFKWGAIVFGCAFAYVPVANLLIANSTLFSLFAANLMAYIAVGLLITAVFASMKKAINGKLIGSDAFGSGEFYLGMMAGLVKFSCIAFVGLALLNARFYSSADIKASLDYQNKFYGSDFFPTLQTVQSQVFEKSLAGPWIKQQLNWLLIKPTVPEPTRLARKEFSLP